MIALFVFGAYRGAWRYFGLMDGVVFAKAIGTGTLALIVAIVYLYRFETLLSRGVRHLRRPADAAAVRFARVIPADR